MDINNKFGDVSLFVKLFPFEVAINIWSHHYVP